jgi:uncharacterized membrane protein YphA (DoxX/SURF4 family)
VVKKGELGRYLRPHPLSVFPCLAVPYWARRNPCATSTGFNRSLFSSCVWPWAPSWLPTAIRRFSTCTRPPTLWRAYVASFTEFLGGLLILAGFFTRPAALAICIDLSVAIWKAHWHNGLTGEHGYEFPLAAAAIAFALIFFGAGPISIDHILRGGGGASKRS